MDQKLCESTHKSINSRLQMYNWVFGIIITLQLLTFSWLGYLSTTVINLDKDYTATKTLLVEKLSSVEKSQSRLEETINKMDVKIDALKENK